FKKYSNFHKVEIVLNGLYEISDASSPPVLVNITDPLFKKLNFDVEASILVQPYHKQVKNGSSYTSAYPVSTALKVESQPVVNDYMTVQWQLPSNAIGTPIELSPANYELEWTYV